MNYRELKKLATPGPWVVHAQVLTRGIGTRGKEVFTHVSPEGIGKGSVIHPNWNCVDGDVWEAWLSCKPENMKLLLHCVNNFDRALELVRIALKNADCPYYGRDNRESDGLGCTSDDCPGVMGLKELEDVR